MSCNIILIGKNQVGKTSYINSITTGKFTNDKSLLSDISQVPYEIVINDKILSINFTTDIETADICIIMIDISDYSSLFYDEIFGVPTILISNKWDLQREISDEILEELIIDMSHISHIPISVKNEYNILYSVKHLVKSLYGPEAIIRKIE